jgi:ubiquitin carboxyl-terminal hydrolase L3
MNRLGHRLGLSPDLSFVDVFSLTEPSLLAMVPRPAYALLFLYPGTELGAKDLAEEMDAQDQYDSCGPEEPVLWFRQTIGHACGTIGLLHCLANGEASKHILPGSDLEQLIQQAVPLKPKERAELLYNSDMLEKAHKEAAQTGDSRAPTIDEPVIYGFTAFVKGKDGHLWELEGQRKGPVDRGVLHEVEDVLTEKALTMGPLRIINREKASEQRFSCLALVDTE